MLQIRHVALRHRFTLRAALPHVANDTNDLHALQRIKGTEDGPAERTLVGKGFSNQRLIHHRNKGSVRRVAVAEAASALQRNSERRERAGGHNRKHHARHTTPIRMRWQLRSEEHTSELQSLTNLVCRL